MDERDTRSCVPWHCCPAPFLNARAGQSCLGKQTLGCLNTFNVMIRCGVSQYSSIALAGSFSSSHQLLCVDSSPPTHSPFHASQSSRYRKQPPLVFPLLTVLPVGCVTSGSIPTHPFNGVLEPPTGCGITTWAADLAVSSRAVPSISVVVG
jgi:hypothetical protein